MSEKGGRIHRRFMGEKNQFHIINKVFARFTSILARAREKLTHICRQLGSISPNSLGVLVGTKLMRFWETNTWVYLLRPSG
jgi:hypothetical protein